MHRIRSRPARPRLWAIVSIELYLIGTFLIYLVGPFAFPMPHLGKVTLFVVSFQVALLFGFMLAERLVKPNAGDAPLLGDRISRRGVTALIAVGESASLLFSYGSLASYTRSWNPLIILDTVFVSIQGTGSAYYDNQAAPTAGTLLTKMSTLTSPLTFATFAIGLYLIRKIPLWLRCLIISDGVFQILTAVIRGTNFGVFKVVLVLVALALLLLLRGDRFGRVGRRAWIVRIGAPVVALVLFVGYFVANTGNRLENERPATLVGVPMDYTSPLVSALPEDLQFDATLVYLYLGQGYNGFSLTMDYPFMSTYGVGNSVFLMSNMHRTLGVDTFPRTYVHRMDSVWSEGLNWHTAYTWFANDVGRVGVVFVMLFLGFFFNTVLQYAMRDDALGVVLLPLILMMLVFLPANNVVMSNPLTCMPFLFFGAAHCVRMLCTRVLGHERARERISAVGILP